MLTTEVKLYRTHELITKIYIMLTDAFKILVKKIEFLKSSILSFKKLNVPLFTIFYTIISILQFSKEYI